MPTTTPTIELAESFADDSLEMNAEGDKFRVAQALQDAIAAPNAVVGGDIWMPPSTPDPRDMEFTSETLPADLVWADQNMVAIVPKNNEALKRISLPTGVPRYKVHTQRRPSWLQWQTPGDGQQRYIHFPWACPIGGSVWCRMTYGVYVSQYNGGAQTSLHDEIGMRLCLFEDLAGKPDRANYVYVGSRFETSPTSPTYNNRFMRGGVVAGGSEATWQGQCGQGLGHWYGSYYGITRQTASTYDFWVASDDGYCSLLDTQYDGVMPSRTGPSSPQHVGIRFTNNPQRVYTMFSLDFIRVSSTPDLLPW